MLEDEDTLIDNAATSTFESSECDSDSIISAISTDEKPKISSDNHAIINQVQGFNSSKINPILVLLVLFLISKSSSASLMMLIRSPASFWYELHPSTAIALFLAYFIGIHEELVSFISKIVSKVSQKIELRQAINGISPKPINHDQTRVMRNKPKPHNQINNNDTKRHDDATVKIHRKIHPSLKPQPWSDYIADKFTATAIQTAILIKQSPIPDTLFNVAEATLESYHRLDRVFHLQPIISTVSQSIASNGVHAGGVVASAFIKAGIAYQRAKGYNEVEPVSEVKVIHVNGVPGGIKTQMRDASTQTEPLRHRKSMVGVIGGVGYSVLSRSTSLVLGKQNAEVLLRGDDWDLEQVRIRVNDVLFITSWRVLMRSGKDSVLYGLYFGNIPKEILKKSDGSFSIDRDADAFQYVLDYLQGRCDLVSLPRTKLHSLLCESKYYKIEKLTHDLETQIALLKNQHTYRQTSLQPNFFNLDSWIPPAFLYLGCMIVRNVSDLFADGGKESSGI
ncbi:hypothetical protein HK098_003131, partial [Nowakowskiella sp. JEL0407]